MVTPGRKVQVAVSEDGLEVIDKMDEHVQGQIAEFLTILALNKSKHLFTPQRSIPDNAPGRVKNEVAIHKGQCFRGAFETKSEEMCALEWYEPNDRSMVFIYAIHWPCNVILDDEN